MAGLPVPFEKLPHVVVIPDDVEIKQPVGVLEDEPLFQTFAAFVEPVSKVTHAKAAVLVDLSEGLANSTNQLADFLALRLGKHAQKVEKARIEISL